MKIYLAGDSTLAAKTPEAHPETGWGEKFQQYFSDEVTIENHGVNGRSTKSFLAENRLAPIIEKLTAEDYLFIQFGHNDQKAEDPARFTEPFTTYQENLTLFINEARKKKVTPVLLTSVTRRDYLANQQLNPATLGQYPQAMRELAQSLNITLIDTFKATQNYFNQLSPEETKKIYLHGQPAEFQNYPEGIQDNTHFQDYGANIVAKIIAKEISRSELPLKHYLKL